MRPFLCSRNELRQDVVTNHLKRRSSAHPEQPAARHTRTGNMERSEVINRALHCEIAGSPWQTRCGESHKGTYCFSSKTEAESCKYWDSAAGPCSGECTFTHDNEAKGGTIWPYCSKKSCPNDMKCRMELLRSSDSHQDLVDAITNLRWDQHSLKDAEKTQHLYDAMNQTRSRFSVRGVPVCASTFCWAHGHGRHRYAIAKRYP